MAITNNNVQNVKFLRNGNIFAPNGAKTAREVALEAMNGQLTANTLADGTAILGRYQEANGKVQTLVGFAYVSGDTKTLTVFDVEGASADVKALREEINAKLGEGITSGNTATAQLAALSGTSSDESGATSVWGAKAYAEDYADGLIDNLEYTGITTGDAAVVTNVTETDGVVSASSANVGALKLTGYEEGTASGHVESTDTINAAVAKLQNQIDAANDNVDAKIGALDGTITADTGYYINKVDEVDGKISGTTAALPTVAAIGEAGKPITAVSESLGAVSAYTGTINAEYVNVTGSVFSSTTVQGALEEIETEYKAADAVIVGGASESADTLGKLEGIVNSISADAKEYHIVKTDTGLPETVKERYSLVDADGNVSGATIDIPKDSHIVSITYSGTTQKMYYTYIDVSGETQTTEVDMSELVLETEFASGITVTDHIAHGVVDPTSETFLTVGTNGFKLSGVQDAIVTAINGLDVSGDTAVAGQYITHINEENGLISIGGRANISEAVLNNYSKGTDATAVADTDTVNQAISKLENQIDAAEEAAKAAATVIASGSSADTTEHLEIATTTDPTTSAKTYTFNLKDIASQTDLNALSAKTFTVATSSNASITTDVTDAADGTKSLDLITDASKIQMSGFTSTDVLSGITPSSSITEAFKEVEKVIAENEETVSAALNDLEATKVENITVNGVSGTVTDKVASVTIDGNDVVLGADYEKPSQGSAIVTGDTVDQALGKLEAKVDAAVAGGVTSIVPGNGIAVDATQTTTPTVSAKLTATSDLPRGIAENAIKFDNTSAPGMYIEYLDCGLYA